MEEIKLVKLEELDKVVEILNDAIKLLSNESTQWQQGYPNKNSFLIDIKNQRLYGYYENNILEGVVALVPGFNEDYEPIEGSWTYKPGDNDITIHRICVKKEYYHKKIGDKLFKFAINFSKEHNYKSIKVDTYSKNERLKTLAIKNNFIYRGIIYIKRNEINRERFAYELVL